MAERKPPGLSWESWIDKQVREADERGEFDNLPGRGKPIESLGKPRDEMWWVRQKLEREQLSFLPTALQLRKDAELVLAKAAQAPSEQKVREIITELNDRIVAAVRAPHTPPVTMLPYDVDEIIEQWRANRPPPAPDPEPEPAPVPNRRRWWRRG
jgi:hypothetical protein